MNRRTFLQSTGIAASALGVAGLGTGCSPEAKPPNIIFIMADDMGYGDLGCYGASRINTPHCDQLAREGIRFTDSHSPSAVCSPTRYGVLTGRYCWRSWLKNWVIMEHMPLLIEPQRPTVASMLKEQGYATGCIGKWHLGWGSEINPDWNEEQYPGPLDVGFDYFFGVPFSHNSTPQLQVFVRNRRIVGLEPDADINNKQTLRQVTRERKNTAIDLSNEAVQFVERNQDRPFFLYYPTTNVHAPLTPNNRFQGKSDAGKYGDFVVEFDWAVGQIMETLDRLDLTERTLVIVTSDNGGHRAGYVNGHKPNGQWRGNKGMIYEGGHRTPFIARWPGMIEPGSRSDETVCLTDFMATCAAINGISMPEGAGEDSVNMLPALLGTTNDSPLHTSVIHHSVAGMFAIRQGKWKLIDGLCDGFPVNWPVTNASGQGKPERDTDTGRFKDILYTFPPFPKPGPGDPPGQLFDLESDPGETNNLWNDNPEIVNQLLTLLRQVQSG
jgi:arylsulfatase A